jgi:hypothetical protein
VFLEALVDPIGLPHWRFAGGTLVQHWLNVLLLPTSVHGSSGLGDRSAGCSGERGGSWLLNWN